MNSELDKFAKIVFDDPNNVTACYNYLLETGLYNDNMLKNTPVSVVCRTAYIMLFTLGDKDMDAMCRKFDELGV